MRTFKDLIDFNSSLFLSLTESTEDKSKIYINLFELCDPKDTTNISIGQVMDYDYKTIVIVMNNETPVIGELEKYESKKLIVRTSDGGLQSISCNSTKNIQIIKFEDDKIIKSNLDKISSLLKNIKDKNFISGFNDFLQKE